jgi:hypothetical protein
MKKNKVILFVACIAMMASSCGIFKKDCNCPHFGKTAAPAAVKGRV